MAGLSSRRRLGAAILLTLVAPLQGCLGLGGSDTPPPAAAATATAPTQAARTTGGGGVPGLPVAGQQAAAAESAQAAAPAPAAADAPSVALLDVFRAQMAVGRMLTRSDDVYAERSAQLALEYDKDGTPRPWINPESGTTGTVTPTRTYQEGGTYCREYSQTIQIRERGSKDIKGQAEAKDGTACRQPDGKWKFQS